MSKPNSYEQYFVAKSERDDRIKDNLHAQISNLKEQIEIYKELLNDQKEKTRKFVAVASDLLDFITEPKMLGFHLLGEGNMGTVSHSYLDCEDIPEYIYDHLKAKPEIDKARKADSKAEEDKTEEDTSAETEEGSDKPKSEE